jgi:hypothetical protein
MTDLRNAAAKDRAALKNLIKNHIATATGGTDRPRLDHVMLDCELEAAAEAATAAVWDMVR